MSVLTLALAKSHLNISVATLTHDDELQTFIDAAEAAITQKCGPLTSVAVTERVSGGGTGLVVRQTPIVSLTSVTPVGGSAYTVGDFSTDLSAGVIEWTNGGLFSTGRYDVVYQAGRTTPDPALLLGVKELVRHMWDTQRGGASRPGSRASSEIANTIAGAAYLWPIRVTQAITPFVQVGND